MVVMVLIGVMTAFITSSRIHNREVSEAITKVCEQIEKLRERSTILEKSVESIGKAATDAINKSNELSNKFEIQKAMGVR